MKRLCVTGEGFADYDVVIGRGVLATAADHLRPLLARPRLTVVCDETVAALHGRGLADRLRAAGLSIDLITIAPGESAKSFGGLEHLLDRFGALGLDRKDTVLALGGGVVGDLAGLAAALYMRGIDVIQAPTTLLAQVDSSVGGKTAIDTARGKNLVGAFHHPRLVMADIDVLATLPVRQLRSGWAEVIKHGLICDAAFFDWLAGDGSVGVSGDAAALERAVMRSVEIKSAVVGDDPREGGRRALLNLGHTFGHALEAELGFDEAVLTHGEAVAVGCCTAFRLSASLGLCASGEAGRVEAVFEAAGLPTRLPAGLKADALIGRMVGDKKSEAGRLVLVLADGIGRARVVRDVETGVVRDHLVAEGAMP
jgi:3-dehydroquinate synthase